MKVKTIDPLPEIEELAQKIADLGHGVPTLDWLTALGIVICAVAVRDYPNKKQQAAAGETPGRELQERLFREYGPTNIVPLILGKALIGVAVQARRAAQKHS
jgi:hypothetical protein